MKNADEIQRAHDRLVAIILNEVPNPFADEGVKFTGNTELEKVLMAQAAVLCWVLEHDHNPAFEKMLEQLDRWFGSLGLTLERGDN